MRDDLLDYYENELTFLRLMGKEFAEKHPKIAALDEQIPFGAAYLAHCGGWQAPTPIISTGQPFRASVRWN